MNKTHIHTALLALLIAAAVGVTAAPSAAPGAWHNMLGEHSAPDWRGWKESGLPAGWHVTAGVLSKDGAVDDLVSNKSYGSFELELEWKIGKEGNSGVFYRGTREYDHIYWSAPEYQLLDDANTEDGKSRLTAAGSDFALYPAPARAGQPCRALVEWPQDRRVRAQERGLEGARRREQVRRVPQLRARSQRAHRAAGRSSRGAGDPQHPDSRATLTGSASQKSPCR